MSRLKDGSDPVRYALKKPAVVIFFVALLIRLFFVGVTYPGNDRVDYFEDVMIALNVLQGEGYSIQFSMRNFLFYEVFLEEKLPDPITTGTQPTALKTPIYPLLVAVVFFLFGSKNFLLIFVLHALLAALTCVFLFFTLEASNRAVATLAALAVAVYPPFVYHSVTSPESTTFVLFLIALHALVLRIMIEDKQAATSKKYWVLIGIIGALLILTDPTTMPFYGLALYYAAFRTFASWRTVVAKTALSILVVVALILPWTIRNLKTFHTFVLLKTPIGQNFARGLQAAGIKLPRDMLLRLEKAGRSLNEAQEDKALKKAALARLADSPMTWVRALPRNFVNYWWEPPRYQEKRSINYIAGRLIPYLILLLLSGPAIAIRLYQLCRYPSVTLGTKEYLDLFLILTLAYTCIYTVFGSWNLRYHFPAELAMCVFAGESLATATHRVSVRLSV